MTKVAAVIPTFNRKESINSVLQQLFSQTQKVNHFTLEVIAVVDGSTDGTLEMLLEEYPKVHIVKGDGSWWYTRSMNEGFSYAIKKINPDWFLTLNDDIHLDEFYMRNLGELAVKIDSNTVVGSLGITMEDEPRALSSGALFRNRCLGLLQPNIRTFHKVSPDSLSGLHDSVVLTGRGMLISKVLMMHLKGFDQKFKQYHSDGDFTLRTIANGFSVKISYDLKIFVQLETTSSSSSYKNRSLRTLIKSYFDSVSRNFVPDKVRFHLRHGSYLCFPFRMMLFFLVSFRNLLRNY